MASLTRNGFREAFTIRFFATIAIVGLAGGVSGQLRVQNSAFRSNFDVFSTMMSSPLVIVFPLAVVLVSCIPTYHEVGHRFIANVRARVDVQRYVRSKLATAVILAVCSSFVFILFSFALAYWVWPMLGNPGVLPAVYGMTSSQASADALTSTSYSSLLAWGPFVYAIAYSAWVGLGGAVFAGLGVAALLLMENRVLAISLPFLAYLVQTIAMSLMGSPQLGVMYSLFPFGLTQQPLFVSAAPLIIFAVATLAIWVWVMPRLHEAEKLS